MKRNKILVGFLLLYLPMVSLAQGQSCDYSIWGRVIDAKSGDPMMYVNVALANQNVGSITDDNGYYRIDHLCEGDYQLVCSMIGYTTAEEEAHLHHGNLEINFKLQETAILLEKVTVAEKALALENTQAEMDLSGTDLASTQGLPLAESLKKLPGVSALTTGSTISKPVIQGMHSNRVLILNNGVRQEGQQWGSEHAPEIDPFIADKISVVKGASSVRYGAGAMGGVILVEPKALPQTKGIGGVFNLQGFSNGQTGIASGILEGALGNQKLPLSARIQGTVKRGGNLQTPNYFLNNTGVAEYNFSWAVGLKKNGYELETFYSRFYTKVGILSSSHIGNLTDLQNAIERERPLGDGEFTYEIGRPQQRISHELTKVQASMPTGEIGKLGLKLTRQFNRRQEFDAHRAFNELPNEISDPSIEFEITTYTADLIWEHKPILNLRGDLGLSFMNQRNTTDRGGLIPNYENNTAGAFWVERWKKYPFPLEFEAGVRYDYNWLSVGQQGQEMIDEELAFNNISGSIGAIYRLPKLVTMRLNVATAWRAPHVSELYSDGVHHGSASYEKGNPDLTSEQAINTSLTTELNNKKGLSASLNLYYNVIQDFIFLQPRATPQLTIRGAFPAFEYNQANARLMGLDWYLNYEFIPDWTFESQVSLLRARNRTIDDYLIFMPADRFQHAIKYTFKQPDDKKNAPYVRFAMTNVLEQTRVPANTDFAPPPPTYTLFDLEAGTTFYWKKQPIEVGLMVMNLFDESYRDYLNRFRYFSDELGRNVSIRMKIPFGKSRS